MQNSKSGGEEEGGERGEIGEGGERGSGGGGFSTIALEGIILSPPFFLSHVCR